MPLGTAFHPRTLPLCESLNYREWAGYYAVSAYEPHHEHEYAAIRNGAALIDVSPLFKYRVTGPDATRLVDRIVTRDTSKVAVGQVIYTPWCDERGLVIDDGTVTRLEEQVWRWTAADPNLRWFRQNSAGLRVTVEETTEEVAALSVQGPTSARLISAASGVDLSGLSIPRDQRHHRRNSRRHLADRLHRRSRLRDLMPWDRAVDVWDRLVEIGRAFDARPAGMLRSTSPASKRAAAHRRRLPRREEGADRPAALFAIRIGARAALSRKRRVRSSGARRWPSLRARGPKRQIVGLEIDWDDIEGQFSALGSAAAADDRLTCRGAGVSRRPSGRQGSPRRRGRRC
jgi:aminomethyltransferase